MKIKLQVTGQHLCKVGNYRLVRDSKKYIKLDFSFSGKYWDDCIKTVVFKTIDGKIGSKIMTSNLVKVPTECAASRSFTVSVFGENRDIDMRITTNPVEIILDASGYAEADEFTKPLPSVYEQIIDACTVAVETAEEVKRRADAGEFNGKDGIDGKNGNDYVLTEKDKEEIAEMVKPAEVETETVEIASDNLYAVAENNNKVILMAFEGIEEGKEIVSVEIKQESTSEWVDLRDMVEADGIPYFINGRRTFMHPEQGFVCFGIVTYPVGSNSFYMAAEAGSLHSAKITYKV